MVCIMLFTLRLLLKCLGQGGQGALQSLLRVSVPNIQPPHAAVSAPFKKLYDTAIVENRITDAVFYHYFFLYEYCTLLMHNN